jgi:hypothetical protein
VYSEQNYIVVVTWSRESSVGIAAVYGLDGRSSIPGRASDFSLLHSVQAGCRAHPASYPMGTGRYFDGLR